MRARFLCGADHRAQILGKAASAESRPRVQELGADACVGTQSLAHEFDVGAHRVAQTGQLVHERDARRQHGVGGVLGQLGRAAVHHQDAVTRSGERRVQGLQGVERARVAGPDDHAIGLHEVVDRIALLEKLGVGCNCEFVARMLAYDRLDLVAGADRHGGLGHQHGPAGKGARGGFCALEDVAEIGRAVGRGRSAHRQNHDHGASHSGRYVGGKGESAFLQVVGDQLVQAGFVDRHLALLEHGDLFPVYVAAGDVVAHVRETRTRDQSDVAGPDDTDFHSGAA